MISFTSPTELTSEKHLKLLMKFLFPPCENREVLQAKNQNDILLMINTNNTFRTQNPEMNG